MGGWTTTGRRVGTAQDDAHLIVGLAYGEVKAFRLS